MSHVRYVMIIIVVLCVCLVAIYGLYIQDSVNNVVYALIIFGLLFAVVLINFYLGIKSTSVEDTFLSKWETTRLIDKINAELQNTKDKLNIEIEQRKALKSSDKLLEGEFRNLFNQISAEVTIEKLQEDAKNKLLAITKIDIIRKVWQEVDNNLKAAISSSRRHQNINLVCGFVTSAAAIVVLLVLIVDPLDKIARTTDTFGIIKHYLPWISLVVIMEIAVFFFFNMYRSNVEAEKHFLNELTTVLIRRIALEAALEGGDKTTTSHVLKILISEERNKVLRKGETSAEVERYKAETEGFEKGINSIGRLMNPYDSKINNTPMQNKILKRNRPSK